MTMDNRIVVLVSGSGSNLQAILDDCAKPDSPGRVVAVISNRPDAYGLERARQAGVAARVLDHREYSDRVNFDDALRKTIDEFQPKLVVLAGFMRILTPGFVQHFAGKLLNIHPSLLPKYPGLHTHKRALEALDAEHGATVHFVTAELDGGPAIVHARVPILPGDDPAILAARVLTQEHIIYPLAIRWCASGRVTLRDGIALLDGQAIPEGGVRSS